MVVVIQAHPYPDQSRANRVLGLAIADLEGVEIRSLYDLYPDFHIDVDEERERLVAASSVVWQHPLYWYTAPALMKLWFEKVLGRGWAYGHGGDALVGKRCLWVVTTGAEVDAYQGGGAHGHPFTAFVPVIEQTARFCRMEWLEPIVVHGAHRISDGAMRAYAMRYRQALQALATESGGGDAPR